MNFINLKTVCTKEKKIKRLEEMVAVVRSNLALVQNKAQFQHPNDSLQLSITAVQRTPHPLPVSEGTVHTQCTDMPAGIAPYTK